jgi:hypothetical protein
MVNDSIMYEDKAIEFPLKMPLEPLSPLSPNMKSLPPPQKHKYLASQLCTIHLFDIGKMNTNGFTL